ncbi:MAG: DegT/DnrJ/EryC1/StrS family aminotransferase [Acetobacteraceae bacterium]|nr:DegT/DnrJ/EryC1/StrS family aminotransferase [Acetobacteraceae bacterium]
MPTFEPPSFVPVANPGASYQALKREIDSAVSRVLESGWYILGEEGRAFEAEFAAWLGVKHAVGCGNGTDALAFALRGLGIGPGKRVATVSHTAVGTVAAIEMAGAEPVLIDIDPLYYTMAPADLEAALVAGPIHAVVVVHLYGQPADLDAIANLCKRHEIPLIEDCAQAHGARLNGRMTGAIGQAAAFSFYPTKNLGAFGDGGLVVTSNAALAERMTALRQYGWRSHYISEEPGVNSRLDEIQAAFLRAKLPRLNAQNARRRTIAAEYGAALGHTPIRPPAIRPGAEHVFHLYVVQCPGRETVQKQLRQAGIGTAVHYPEPVHLQPAYRGRVALGPAACRVTEAITGSVLSLPIFPELTEPQVDRVCEALRGLF